MAICYCLFAMKNNIRTAAAESNHHWFILYRTGGVWSSFEGDLAAAEAECAYRNGTDEQGETVIYAGFATRQECEEEFYFLIDKTR
jgi:hypothetical protein